MSEQESKQQLGSLFHELVNMLYVALLESTGNLSTQEIKLVRTLREAVKKQESPTNNQIDSANSAEMTKILALYNAITCRKPAVEAYYNISNRRLNRSRK